MTRTSLYRHFAEDGELLYIGISVSALSRLGQHEKHAPWFDKICHVTVEHFDTRKAALEAERNAIQAEKPTHNKHHNRPELEAATRYVEEKAERDREELINRMVWFKPFYKVAEAADLLRMSTPAVKKLIRSGELSAVVLSTNTMVVKGQERRTIKYGITGWQLIEYIERLEFEKGTKS